MQPFFANDAEERARIPTVPEINLFDKVLLDKVSMSSGFAIVVGLTTLPAIWANSETLPVGSARKPMGLNMSPRNFAKKGICKASQASLSFELYLVLQPTQFQSVGCALPHSALVLEHFVLPFKVKVLFVFARLLSDKCIGVPCRLRRVIGTRWVAIVAAQRRPHFLCAGLVHVPPHRCV